MAKQQFPEPTVGALIFNPEGKLLLMRSHKWRDKYVVPGGHIELGEHIEDALKREVKEETGLDVTDQSSTPAGRKGGVYVSSTNQRRIVAPAGKLPGIIVCESPGSALQW